MNLQLQIPPEAEAKLRNEAAATGQKVEEFVLRTVMEKLSTEPQEPIDRSPKKGWSARFRAWAESQPKVTHFVDDSRESIYEGRGE